MGTRAQEERGNLGRRSQGQGGRARGSVAGACRRVREPGKNEEVAVRKQGGWHPGFSQECDGRWQFQRMRRRGDEENGCGLGSLHSGRLGGQRGVREGVQVTKKKDGSGGRRGRTQAMEAVGHREAPGL